MGRWMDTLPVHIYGVCNYYVQLDGLGPEPIEWLTIFETNNVCCGQDAGVVVVRG